MVAKKAKKKNKGLQSFLRKNFNIKAVSTMAYGRLEHIWSKL